MIATISFILFSQGMSGDWEMTGLSEEDQMMRAIAMSLGETLTSEEESSSESGARAVTTETLSEVKPEESEVEPLPKEAMDKFTSVMLPGCLRLLDTLPDTVYRVCDLLLAVAQRNGEQWCVTMLRELLHEINLNVNKLLESAQPMRSYDRRSVSEWASQVTQIPEASKAATRIHLYTLFFEEMRIQCASLIAENNVIDNMVHLLEAALNLLNVTANNSKGGSVSTPKWLAPLILLIDLYDKAAIASGRKAPLVSVQKRQWKWFDERTGRWSAYQPGNNKTIDEAYKKGEQYIRFTAGRRRYTVQFSTMVQINEETGNWRPIMFTVDEKAMEVSEEGSPAGTSDLPLTFKTVKGLEPDQSHSLIRALVGFIKIPVEADTLHAVLRLCLRLTRSYETSSLFAELGGVRAILQLTQASAFTGFTSLATLIIRHVLEEPFTLRQTMEKVIRSTTHHSPQSNKEMHFIMRNLGPAACRDGELFKDVAKSVLRINIAPGNRREEEETRLLSSNSCQQLRLLPAKQTNGTVQPVPITREVICDLLNALAVKVNNSSSEETQENLSETKSNAVSENDIINRDLTASEVLQSDDVDSVEESTVTVEPNKSTATNEEDANKKSRLLLTQSSILRLLAELTRSYSVVAKLICEHTYQSGQSELISDECSALAFILDNLLPPTQTIGDRDCPALARVLLSSLASCNHCIDAQTTLVNEVKSALHRALALVESNEKHVRVQAITSLISTMIDSCPSMNQSPSQQNMASSLRNQAGIMNNIVRILLRRGLVTDLARVTHSLDLSSPHMAQTINSTLKPLETLSRIVNILPPVAIKSKSNRQGENTNNPESVDENNMSVSANIHEINTATGESNDNQNNVQLNGDLSGMTTETSASETNAFVTPDVAVDENTDNEAVVIDEGVVPFELYNDNHHSRSNTLLSDDIRTDDEEPQHEVEHENADDHEHNDNVINSNGAESESGDGDESQSDDDDDDGSGQDEERDDDDDDDDDEDDDDEEHIDEEDDGEEDEDASGYVENDDIGDIFRLQDRDEAHLVFDLEDMFPPSVFQAEGGSVRLTSLLPMLGDEHVNGNDNATPTVPPAPGNVTTSHPLLLRHSDMSSSAVLSTANSQAGAGILSTRAHRGRQRMYRPMGTGNAANHHSWHIPNPSRHPNPPAILQRLLGPNTAQDILQLTSGISSGSSPARVILTSNDFHILATEDDLLDLQDPTFISGNGTSTLSSIPSAMQRWNDESRVLDGDSLHDCVLLIKADVVETLEKYRDEELAERKEKRKKMVEEEEKVKKENEAEKQKNETENDNITESEQSVINMNTERLAESLVEQVLGPAMISSSNREDEVAMPLPTQMEVTEDNIEEISQNDNEVSEMICSEAQFQPERIEVDTSSNEREENSVYIENLSDVERPTALVTVETNTTTNTIDTVEPTTRPPPPERTSSEDVGIVITPEDLSTVTNTSSEGMTATNNGDASQEPSSDTVSNAGAPLNKPPDSSGDSDQGSSNTQNTPSEFSTILGGKFSTQSIFAFQGDRIFRVKFCHN